MSDDGSFFTSVQGFIQFDVDERELDSGQTVRDATIRSMATGELVRITFWPDFDEVPLERGDLIAVDGKGRVRVVGDNEYFNMNARRVVRQESFEGERPEVVEKPKRAGRTARKTF